MYILKFILLFIPWLTLPSLYAQHPDQQAVLAEGYQLYHSEMASWYGTDLFMSKYPHKKEKAEGYLSYTDGQEHRCLFFSKENDSKVLVTFTFDDTFDLQTARIDSTERPFSTVEQDLYQIRKKALAQIRQDTLFKQYKNTSLNLIPVINKDLRKVYVLTGPSQSGQVIIGNDYLLTFNQNNQLISQKPLHRNIIPIKYAQDSSSVITMHTHLPETGDIITATDICTLLLYQKYAHWKQHYVISQNYVSIWDCPSSELITMKREAWDKIAEHQKSIKKKRQRARD